MILVISSWTGFCFDHKCIPARVFLPTTVLLAMVTLGLSKGPTAGDPTHVTASDVYQFCCFAFIFASLVEFALVHHIASGAKYRKKRDLEGSQSKTSLGNSPTYVMSWTKSRDAVCSLPGSRSLSRESTRYNLLDDDNPRDLGTMETADTQKDDTSIVQRKMTSDDTSILQRKMTSDGCVSGHSKAINDTFNDKDELLVSSPRNYCEPPLSESDYSAHRVDVWSQFLFPAIFIFFNIVYWAIWTKRSPSL